LFFQVVSSLHVSPPKPCMPLSSPPYGPYAAPVSFFLVGWACGTYGTPDDFKYTSVPRYMPARTRPPIFRFYNSCLQTLCKIRIATLRRVAKPVPRQDNSTATKKGTHARFRCPIGSSKPWSQCSGGVRQYTAETVATFSMSLLIP
jgi:hypothetical protein